ncbi:MAG TPA: glutathione S-transferase family protein [Burkholderiaceae bacterium]|nr:glutathione S-transferase family protein [Burkholderiaceae bacterium]
MPQGTEQGRADVVSPAQADFSDAPGLVLYHGLASTCSQKVRLALIEKQLPYTSRLLDLRKFEQHDPRYLRINADGMVPSLVVDGLPVIESNVILEFIEDAFPQVPLAPTDPHERARMRVMTRFSDTFAYNSVLVMTWDRLIAPRARQLKGDELAAVLQRIPNRERRDRWKAMASGGFSQQEIDKSLQGMRETLRRVEQWASQGGEWLLPCGYSLADVALVPYVQRIFMLCPELGEPQAGTPALLAWYERMLERPAVQRAMFFKEDPRAAGLRAA